MSVPAECAVCHKHKMCLKVGLAMVCILCLGIYNEIRTIVLEAGAKPADVPFLVEGEVSHD